MTGSGRTTTGNEAGGLDAARVPATSRRRAYAAALRAARALAGFEPTGILRLSGIDTDPETIERYCHLLILSRSHEESPMKPLSWRCCGAAA
ncbi:MAG: hypothetical protein ABTQ27_15540 [Amaricoccus sp.]|uniref:hypothetical protein n=1 Tax=Amaricoccus sp. TaxID=1872485 RepID=UPI003314A07E